MIVNRWLEKKAGEDRLPRVQARGRAKLFINGDDVHLDVGNTDYEAQFAKDEFESLIVRYLKQVGAGTGCAIGREVLALLVKNEGRI